MFLHWTWFLVALYEIETRKGNYDSISWNVLEYVALFAIVLMHEFGHALACRQVGGQANRIVLWPLGGVAYVAPPRRPGATLWAIAAGPLVNVVLLPLTFGAAIAGDSLGLPNSSPNAFNFLWMIAYINAGLLAFNLLPIYPLDGGQILRSLLWFFFGRARSLMITVGVGVAGTAGLVALAIYTQSIWMGAVTVFMLLRCWNGFRQARILLRIEKAPLRPDRACPDCHAPPPMGDFWICHKCRTRFDTFAVGAICPKCQTQFSVTRCVNCGGSRPIGDWDPQAPPVIVRASG